MVSNLIIGLVELVHEEERVGCKKISVEVYILKNTHEESHAWFIIIKKKCINKCIWKKNDDKERKRMRKEGRKRYDGLLKERIGGWKYMWRNSVPLV